MSETQKRFAHGERTVVYANVLGQRPRVALGSPFFNVPMTFQWVSANDTTGGYTPPKPNQTLWWFSMASPTPATEPKAQREAFQTGP